MCYFGYRTKPWLSLKKEDDEVTIKKYFTMWQTKKVNLLGYLSSRLDDRATLTFACVDILIGACTEKETPGEEAPAATRCDEPYFQVARAT